MQNLVHWLMTDGYPYYAMVFLAWIGIIGADLSMDAAKGVQAWLKWREEYTGSFEYAYW